MTQTIVNNNTIYLILDGSKTVDKSSFLNELVALLHFPDYSDEEDFKYASTWDWEGLIQHLNNVVFHWERENPDYIELISDEHGVIPKDTKVNIIWIHPINFSAYNNADFLIALDVLKSINEDKDNPLIFLLAGDISSINTEMYK